MPPCIAYQELLDSLMVVTENFPPERITRAHSRLEWMLQRHNTDGSDGCDWCLMAEEIRRLRAGLREIDESLEKDLRQGSV
jgi:hypothetical protein